VTHQSSQLLTGANGITCNVTQGTFFFSICRQIQTNQQVGEPVNISSAPDLSGEKASTFAVNSIQKMRSSLQI
jgi:hypothetical protein